MFQKKELKFKTKQNKNLDSIIYRIKFSSFYVMKKNMIYSTM